MSDDFTVDVDLNKFLRAWGKLTGKLPGTIEAIVTELAEMAKDLYEGTVKKWTKGPKFSVTITRRGDDIIAAAGTNDKIYEYVHDGTGPRDIVPRNPGGVLVFRSTYKARTRPGSLRSGRKWRGGALIFCKRVKDHRIRPRRFTVGVFRRVKDAVGAVKLKHIKTWVRVR